MLCAACLNGIPVWKWYCKLVGIDSGECALLISFLLCFLAYFINVVIILFGIYALLYQTFYVLKHVYTLSITVKPDYFF